MNEMKMFLICIGIHFLPWPAIVKLFTTNAHIQDSVCNSNSLCMNTAGKIETGTVNPQVCACPERPSVSNCEEIF